VTPTITPTTTSTLTPTPTVTPTSVPIVPTCSVLFNSPDSPYVFFYDVLTNTTTPLNVPSSYVASDIAHTTNKLWLGGGSLKEWNITLSPFSAILNRTITLPHSIGPGLGSINDTTLIAVNSSTTPNSVVTLDITSSPAVSTFKFNMLSGRSVAGDILLTTTNKVLITNNGSGGQYITQYDYITGAVEVDILISPTITAPWGVFQDNNQIYIMDGNNINNVFHINKDYPYVITLTGSTGYSVYGASQIPSCLTTNFNIGPTPTPTTTPTNTTTPTITPTITPTNTITPTITPTNTITPTRTVTPTITPTRTVTPTITPTITPTKTPTLTPTNTQTPTVTPTLTPNQTCYTFNSDQTNIIINDNNQASVYPVTFTVSGINTPITDIKFLINGYTIIDAGDVGMVLLDPNNTNYTFIAGRIGSINDATNINVTLTSYDTTVWNGYSGGTYKNNSIVGNTMLFNSPCPLPQLTTGNSPEFTEIIYSRLFTRWWWFYN
jgi:hypothetical protein